MYHILKNSGHIYAFIFVHSRINSHVCKVEKDDKDFTLLSLVILDLTRKEINYLIVS